MPPRKTNLSRIHEYVITQAEDRPNLIGNRCRLVLSAPEQECETVAGLLLDLQAYMLSGPFKGNVIDLPPVKVKFAQTDRSCRCPAYKFPHARGLGKCKSEEFEQVAPEGIDLESIFTRSAS